jgi:hypothetical protein
MDKITRGMSQAGRHPQQCCTRKEGLIQRMTHSLKGVAARVRHFLGGKEGAHPASARR